MAVVVRFAAQQVAWPQRARAVVSWKRGCALARGCGSSAVPRDSPSHRRGSAEPRRAAIGGHRRFSTDAVAAPAADLAHHPGPAHSPSLSSSPHPSDGGPPARPVTYSPDDRAMLAETLRALVEDPSSVEAARRHDVHGDTWSRAARHFRTELMAKPEVFFADADELQAFVAKCRSAFANVDAAVGVRQEVLAQLLPGVIETAHKFLAEELRMARLIRDTTDLRSPPLWYPEARTMKRRIIYHAGPTNSGKTYNAMQALKRASSGVYCGPLRLLALEVYETLNMDGVYTDLLTGQERRTLPFASHVSCTVEMTNVHNRVDVAVIDEIQMIADEGRGFAWTRALLGVQADEVHLCGDPSAIEAVRGLAAVTGDDFEVVTYDRLTKLTTLDYSLGGEFNDVRAGDCIIAFSRRDIYAIRRLIENSTPHKCCVVYGALPSETRSAQARLFNEAGTGWDVLVASDAVGMGLNLNIRRVVFSTMDKYDGRAHGPVEPPLVKQIAGRAGRWGSLYPDGEVTTLNDDDMPYLREALAAPPPVVEAVGLFPNIEQIEVFAQAMPHVRLSTLLDRFVESARVDGQYFMCGTRDMKQVANSLNNTPLKLADRFTLCGAPINTRNLQAKQYFERYARAYSNGEEVAVGVQLPMHSPRNALELETLESKHLALDTYMWMAQRFPAHFVEVELATILKQQCVAMIEAGLEQLSKAGAAFQQRQQRRVMRRKSNAKSNNERNNERRAIV